MMKIKLLKKVAATALGLFLAAGMGSVSASGDHALMIDGMKTELHQGMLIVDGWTYVPVREFAERMGWQLAYDKVSRQITVANAIGDSLTMQMESSAITFNGNTFEISDGVKVKDEYAYFPLRTLAEAMHVKVGWHAEERMAVIEPEPAHIVESGDTLSGLAQTYGTTAEALQVRNGISDEPLEIGQRLKVVVPEFMDPSRKAAAETAKAVAAQVNQADLKLLAKLVEAEAGSEPYEGKLAVASVVMNRVKDDRYPDTVKGVIYAPNQFSPARNGKLDKISASKDSIKAAEAALSGENNVPGAVYFFNPKLEPGKLKKVEVVKEIGNHVFAK